MPTITASADQMQQRLPVARSLGAVCDRLAIFALAIVTIIALMTFRDYGLGWDDYTHAEYAEMLLSMYGTGFADKSALSFANLFMYGGGFDMAAALLHHLVPFDVFETRRLLGAIVGLIGLAMVWRLGRRVGGPVAGLAALLLLAMAPIFYGHLFMNPKDAPFAVAMIALMLGLVRLVQEYPEPSPRTVLLVGFATGVAVGCRILAGFALFYVAIGCLPLFKYEIQTYGLRGALARLLHTAKLLVPALVLSYLVMGLIWPWSIIEPGNPFRAVTYFSHFFEKPWKEMFDGALVSVPDMPWSYLPTLFTLQLPEVLIILTTFGVGGALLSLVRKNISPKHRSILLMLVLAALLPLVFAMVKRPALYNGIRHFIFVIPPMAVLGGVAFGALLRRSREPAVKLLTVAMFCVGLALPLTEMVRLHPYQYTYFNHTAGTVRRADNLFMLDYWGLAFKQASSELREFIEAKKLPQPEGRKWKAAVCGPQRPAQVALGPQFDIGWDSVAADFAMTLGEFYCKNLNAPVVAEIKRDDVIYARVYDIRGLSIASVLATPSP